jgi:PmbA protein
VPDLAELCRWAVEAARGKEDVEAWAEESRRVQVRVREGEVEWLTFAEARGMGIRVVMEGRLGYAYAADPDEQALPELVARAREGAGLAEPDPGNVLPSLGPVDPVPGLFRPAQAEVDPDRKVSLALDLERAATRARPEVRRVESAAYGDAVSRVVLGSTRGGPLEYARTDAWVSVTALADRDGETQSGSSFDLRRELGELAIEAVAQEAAERAARLLGAERPRTERLPVVLDPVAAAGFLGVLAGALSAEAVQKGRSLLAGRIGQTVASPAVTLVDDGRLSDGPASAPLDDEGVPTQRTILLEEGALRSFLHNTYTAARAGGRSTGNAGRSGYRTPPGVAPTNLYLQPGSISPQELLERAGRAIYVQDLTGLHSGASPVSGQFSVGATGLRVEGGALAGPLREMTIASALLEVLAGVVAVASDLRFPVGGGLGSPTVLIEGMTVAGT